AQRPQPADQRTRPSDSKTTTPPNSTPPTLPPTTAPSDEKKDDTSKEPTPSVVQQPDDSKVKHDGSKNDVNAIGNRKVGGRGLGDWYSLEGEIRMGKQYAQEVEATSKLIRDPVITEYVNRIGQNLVRNSDAQVALMIIVVDSYEVKALAPPCVLSCSSCSWSEAHYLGLQYRYKSCYDPNSVVQFFEKLQAREKKKPGTLAKAFATHPQTPDRTSKSQEEISRILPARQQYIVTTSEFADVKSRLASLENRRKPVDDKGGNRPSLRRTSTSDKSA